MIRAVIVDDEELASIYLQKKLQEFPIVRIVKTLNCYRELLGLLENEKIDVLFLDIEMGDANGLKIAEEILSIHSSIHIVFVTAYSDYAVQAFELNSIDYLLKPITAKRLEKTIDRLIKLLDKNKEDLNQKVMTKQLKITCFNELQIFQGQQLLHFKTAKVKELFAFLFTHLGTYIHKDIIIEKLWSAQDYKKSKAHLHTCLSHLRKMLESHGYSNCISFSNQCYSLNLTPIHCDSIELDSTLNTVDSLDETTIHTVTEIIEQYKGPYLELNHYDWSFEKANQYQKKMLVLLDHVINYYGNKDPNKTLYYLQRQLKINPYLEKSVKKCMEILTYQGERSIAVKMYQEFETLLLNDLGIHPNRSLTQLYQSLIPS